ncbi:MAG: DEAD/DEAH box helicase [Candidatus Thorarchaeota archaeon]|nr:DEAD/DEAH box helicase [Candidatus Thorarchaeota archaeon]
MTKPGSVDNLRARLKALSNRYAVDILKALSPQEGDIVPTLGWEGIVDRVLENQGFPKPTTIIEGERTQEQQQYETRKKQISTGGTLYESMEKLVNTGFVKAMGEKGKKRRKYMITHDGRLALAAAELILGPTPKDTEMGRAAKILLRYKNFVRLLPAQAKFLNEVKDVEGNLILQMPPGSGKTFIGMMIILTRLQKGTKCLYLTPLISISRQFITEYKDLLQQLGYSVVRYDAHSDASDEMLEEADLIVGIYESVLTASIRRENWLKKIGLTVVDELTELGGATSKPTSRKLGDDRSCRLDLLITWLKNRSQIITLSSRFGDTDTVAKWLKAEVFRPSVRLVPDEYVVVPDGENVRITSADGTHHFLSSKKSRLDAIHEYMGDYSRKALLVVVGSRENAEHYARRIAESYPRPIDEKVIDRIIGSGEQLPAASRLRQLLKQGVAFHHAGLKTDLRGRLEHELKLGNVHCVVSTTGIASGTSFPFDAVAIMFGRGLQAFVNRARYLQIAGRIGEYYLAEHGGQVFIALPKESSDDGDVSEIAQELLHNPLEPLCPGPVDPYLMCSVLTKEIITHRRIDQEKVTSQLHQLIQKTLRGTVNQDYKDSAREQVARIYKWMCSSGILTSDNAGVYVSKDAKNAILGGMNPLDYISIRDLLLDDSLPDEDDLVEILLKFRLVQSSRPRTVIPTKIEMDVANLEDLNDWYREQVPKRLTVKREVIRGWINEKPIKDLIEQAIERGIEGNDRARRWIGLDEGDMTTMVDWAADISTNIADYLKRGGRKKRAKLFQIFSKRLRYGLKEDAATTNLMTLEIPTSKGRSRHFSRTEIRTLIDNGYTSIEAIVKKDIDSSKRKPARKRFAENSGLDQEYAIEVYKAALQYIRSQAIKES